MLRLALFAIATWVAGDIGFATFRPEFGTAMIWPVTGVALVWAATGNRRTWPVDAVVLVVVSVVALRLADATWGQGLMGGLQTVLQAAVYLVVMRRLAPEVWSGGGRRPMVRLADLGAFALAVAVGALAATGLRALGLGLIPTPELTDSALVWVRNFCGMFTIGTLALLVGPLLGDSRSRLRAAAHEWWGRWPARGPELVVVSLVSLALYAAVFWQREPLPVSFVLLLPTLWAGLRMSPVVAAGLSLALGLVALVLTLDSRGLFADVEDPRIGALLAQAFVVSTLTFSTAVALVSSERLRASAQAQRSERESAARAATLSAVLEQIREGIMVVRADGVMTLQNPALGMLPGAEADQEPPVDGELRVPPVYDLQGELIPPERQPLARAMAGEVVADEHVVVRDADGGDRTLEVAASLLPGDPEDLGQVLVVLRDVTHVREREDSLAAFAGVVAHDLNNPLTVVSGWADALADSFQHGDVDGATGTMITTRIQDATTHMRRFIDDLLSYTVARDRPMQSDDVDLSALAEEVAQLRRGTARFPRIDVQPGLWVRGDVVLLRQLLDNLLGNAVKYVAADRVPTVSLTGRVAGESVEVWVTDNGVGVPPAQRERIFETFVRAHPAQFAGTGLGLGICRKVVERHGGTLHVEDAPGATGSRFVMTLPATDGPPRPERHAAYVEGAAPATPDVA